MIFCCVLWAAWSIDPRYPAPGPPGLWTLEFHVGVVHLLNLGLRVALGELLGVLLQLLAVVLDLALQATNRLRVEVLRALLACCWSCC